MKILYVTSKYDWGKVERGVGPEHHNFLSALQEMGHQVVEFDFIQLANEKGRDGMNQALEELVALEKPEVMFVVLAYDDTLSKETIRRISSSGLTITVNWFSDDHFRFGNYTAEWAPCFNWSVTTDADSLKSYNEIGYSNVILSQWACNPARYPRGNGNKKYDVSFVGSKISDRGLYIDALREAGIDVKVWGGGWDSPRLSHEEMVEVFQTSLINLNFSRSSCPVAPLGKGVSANGSRFARRIGRVRKAVEKRLHGISISPPPTGERQDFTHYPRQIKGRVFEVPACCGMLLTEKVAHLETYFEVGEEIAVFGNPVELVEMVRYYIENRKEALRIAEAGYHRVVGNHTYAHRFLSLFDEIDAAKTLTLS
jgi:spore maturation protein CgeB